MFKKRAIKRSTNKQTLIRRNLAGSSSDSDSDSDGEDGQVVMKKAKKAFDSDVKTAASASTSNATPAEYKSVSLSNNDSATHLDTLNRERVDARLKDSERSNQVEEAKINDDDDVYKGQANYTTFIKPKANSMEKIGPKKQTANIRSTTLFDFQRDVCKDFKETGYCGYGDTCKFLHARDDFKANWKLDRDWDLLGKEKEEKLESKLKDVPFKCAICKNKYSSPIKTRCNHYFCEVCFLKRTKRNPNCFICNENTNGVAIPAKDLQVLLKN